MKPQKLSDDIIQSTLTNAIENAVEFISSEIAPDRDKAQKYASGEVDKSAEEGRSKVVATKCRDTLRAVKPSLMRLFLQSGKPVEFVPRGPNATEEAEQKTSFASYVFDRNDGFMLLSDAFDDALKKKVGILKCWMEESEDAEVDNYSGIAEEQALLIANEEGVEVLEAELTDGVYDLKVSKKSKRGEIKIKAVAPEDFFVDRSATSINDCYVCGHSQEMRVGDVVAMGFDFEEVYELTGDASNSSSESEEVQRTGWDNDGDESKNDPSMRKIVVTEAYMKMDIEGLGIPKLYKFICASDKYKILSKELCDVLPFAVFEVDPEAHTFFGKSLVDIIINDQDTATSLLRGLIDNMNMVNNPRLEVVETQVSMPDVLNTEIGGIIRVKQPNVVREIAVGGMATAIMPVIQYYDEVIRGKTGVSGAGMGLDADMLQSQTAQGVNAAVQAANQVSELIARYLAEGGMKQLFKIIVQLARQNPDPETMVRVNGKFIPVDPRSWTVDADLVVNVGLGTNRHEEKVMALQTTLQVQQGIWQAYGPQNGIITMTKIRNTLADLLALSGVHNADRYYNPMDEQIEAQLMQQAAAASQGQQQASDPNAAFLQAEQMKVSARVQADMAKSQVDMQKAVMEDDRERDKMAQDLAIKVAEILAKTGLRIDTSAIQQQQDIPRNIGGALGQ